MEIKAGDIWVRYEMNYKVRVLSVDSCDVIYQFIDEKGTQQFSNTIKEFLIHFYKDEPIDVNLIEKVETLSAEFDKEVQNLNQEQIIKVLSSLLRCEEILQNAIKGNE